MANSVQESSSREGRGQLADQEIPGFSSYVAVHTAYCRQSQILNHMDLIRNFTPCSFQIHLNMILQSAPTSSKVPLIDFRSEVYMCMLSVPLSPPSLDCHTKHRKQPGRLHGDTNPIDSVILSLR